MVQKNRVEAGVLKSENNPVKDRVAKIQEALPAKPQGVKPTDLGAKPADPVWANGKALGLSENCIRVLQSRYLKKGPDGKCTETPEELFTRVAHTVASAEARYGKKPSEIAQIERDYMEMMVKGIYMPNSPTLMNAGREMG